MICAKCRSYIVAWTDIALARNYAMDTGEIFNQIKQVQKFLKQNICDVRQIVVDFHSKNFGHVED
jgi:signal transduction histidine kinase